MPTSWLPLPPNGGRRTSVGLDGPPAGARRGPVPRLILSVRGVRRTGSFYGGGQEGPCSVLAAGVDQAQDDGALLVGGLQVDLDVEAPVVVARGVVEDLP